MRGRGEGGRERQEERGEHCSQVTDGRHQGEAAVCKASWGLPDAACWEVQNGALCCPLVEWRRIAGIVAALHVLDIAMRV